MFKAHGSHVVSVTVFNAKKTNFSLLSLGGDTLVKVWDWTGSCLGVLRQGDCPNTSWLLKTLPLPSRKKALTDAQLQA